MRYAGSVAMERHDGTMAGGIVIRSPGPLWAAGACTISIWRFQRGNHLRRGVQMNIALSSIAHKERGLLETRRTPGPVWVAIE